jgi:hypothetical protein
MRRKVRERRQLPRLSHLTLLNWLKEGLLLAPFLLEQVWPCHYTDMDLEDHVTRASLRVFEEFLPARTDEALVVILTADPFGRGVATTLSAAWLIVNLLASPKSSA